MRSFTSQRFNAFNEGTGLALKRIPSYAFSNGSFKSSRPPAVDEIFDHRGVFQRADAELDAAKLPFRRCVRCSSIGLAGRVRWMDGGAATRVQLFATIAPGGAVAFFFNLSTAGAHVCARSIAVGTGWGTAFIE